MSNDLYTCVDDLRLQYKDRYQLRLRQFDVNEWHGDLFENRSRKRYKGKTAWRRTAFEDVCIKDGRVQGLPHGSYLELYVIKMWNNVFPEAKIQSKFWNSAGKPQK